MEFPEDRPGAPDSVGEGADAGPSPNPAAEPQDMEISGPEAPEEAPDAPGGGKKVVAVLLAALLLLGGIFSFRLLSQPGETERDGKAGGIFTWERLPFPPIDPRYGHAAVWTGSKMVIWGGFSGVAAQASLPGAGIRSDGAQYEPRTGEWALVPQAPVSHRPYMPAVWTGTEMAAWGGDPAQPATAVAFNPQTGIWRLLPPAGVPFRIGQSSVWTGGELIVWGGSVAPADSPDPPGLSSAGAVYSFQTNAWREIPPAPLAPRDGHSAIWTGKEMIVWGGAESSGEGLRDGAAFDPATNNWRTLPAAPVALDGTAVWSGTEMFIWGDRQLSATSGKAPARYAMEGLSFHPGTGRWRTLPAAPMTLRTGAQPVWSGARLYVWGGFTNSDKSPPADSGPARDGAAYQPSSNRWEPIPGAPIAGRDFAFSMVAAGDSVIVWGGKASERAGRGTTLADGARLSPATP